MTKHCMTFLALALLALAFNVASSGPLDDSAKPKLETLMRAELARVAGTEVILSRVTVPPKTSLPKHWHPGEEFAYILEGSASLWLEGEVQTTFGPGEVLSVPLKKVHTAITGEEGAVILVFRVHESGQPERVLVE
ncbi:MAG: cupin domain-containing protein [Gammaproteobacteria bacterium]|nr:cupin domain-containing protein [Gammaproteobacteria bacterium]